MCRRYAARSISPPYPGLTCTPTRAKTARVGDPAIRPGLNASPPLRGWIGGRLAPEPSGTPPVLVLLCHTGAKASILQSDLDAGLKASSATGRQAQAPLLVVLFAYPPEPYFVILSDEVAAATEESKDPYCKPKQYGSHRGPSARGKSGRSLRVTAIRTRRGRST